MKVFWYGDKVKHIDQEIWGIVLRQHNSEVVIQDMESEFESPDDELVFRSRELCSIDKFPWED